MDILWILFSTSISILFYISLLSIMSKAKNCSKQMIKTGDYLVGESKKLMEQSSQLIEESQKIISSQQPIISSYYNIEWPIQAKEEGEKIPIITKPQNQDETRVISLEDI